MKCVHRLLVVLPLALAASCSNQDTPVPAAADGAASQQAQIDNGPRSEELGVGALIPAPMLIASGGVAQVAVRNISAGAVSTVGVQIGNFSGATDGDLSVTLCKGVECASGSASLLGTVDNTYVDVVLDQKLAVEAGDSLTLKVGKDGGSKDVAIWLYAAAEPMTAPDGTSVNATPKLKLVLN